MLNCGVLPQSWQKWVHFPRDTCSKCSGVSRLLVLLLRPCHGQVNGPQRMVSARCSDRMGVLVQSQYSAPKHRCIREATRRSEAQHGWHHRRGLTFLRKQWWRFLCRRWPSWRRSRCWATRKAQYETIQAELKRAKYPSQLQPASVRLQHCGSFIERV